MIIKLYAIFHYMIHFYYITLQNITAFLVIYNKDMIVWGIKSKLQDWHDMINLLFVTWLIGLHKLSCLQRIRSFGQRNICQHATDFMQHNHDLFCFCKKITITLYFDSQWQFVNCILSLNWRQMYFHPLRQITSLFLDTISK